MRREHWSAMVAMRLLVVLMVTTAILFASPSSSTPVGVAAAQPSSLPLKTEDEEPIKIWKPPPGEDEDALRREAAKRKYDPERLAANERGKKAWEAQQRQRRLDELEGRRKPRKKPPPPPPPSKEDVEKEEM